MPYSAKLCSTCRRVLCSELEVKPSGLVEETGQTFEQFREAVEQGCAICSTMWNAEDQHPKAWAQILPQAWKAAMFTIWKDQVSGIDDVAQVIVGYLNPINNRAAFLWFFLLSPSDSRWNPYFEHLKIEPSTSSTATLTVAHNWFSNCCSSHLRCNESALFTSDWLPARLIDVGRLGSTDWRLRITSEDGILPQSAPYMTLSYRWALKPSLILLTSNIDEFRGGKPIQSLSQLFQDVIGVVQRFSIRYIWIDALCIIQDSREDWETQASTMRMVYANSTCNIAASGADSPDEGLFRARNPEKIQPGLVPCSLSSSEVQPHYIFERYYWDREIRAGPLHNRGWVFQERILAPRVLHFAKNQILWECLTEHKCEGFPNGIPGHRSDKDMDLLLDSLSGTGSNKPQEMDSDIHYQWNELVKKYSRCALTYPSDKLFAIAGIAQLFRDATGDEYVAGLWKSRLIEMLDWRVYEPETLQSSGYRAPSWSWASVDGPVRTFELHKNASCTVELLDVHIQTRTSSIMADVLEASITLRAKIIQTVCHYLEDKRRVLLTKDCQLSCWLHLDTLGIELPEGKKIICMPFIKDFDGSIICLILEELSSPSGSQARYRRLGMFVEHNAEYIDIFNTRSEVQDIRIV
ncbi:heterokaryon incompatibility protein-domain-containing protein [Xylaria curta]|nr:heterokaryon incompatibility protein-domain-containing protein [Xylaria curta]